MEAQRALSGRAGVHRPPASQGRSALGRALRRALAAVLAGGHPRLLASAAGVGAGALPRPGRPLQLCVRRRRNRPLGSDVVLAGARQLQLSRPRPVLRGGGHHALGSGCPKPVRRDPARVEVQLRHQADAAGAQQGLPRRRPQEARRERRHHRAGGAARCEHRGGHAGADLLHAGDDGDTVADMGGPDVPVAECGPAAARPAERGHCGAALRSLGSPFRIVSSDAWPPYRRFSASRMRALPSTTSRSLNDISIISQ
mmetsp:Transcript_109754/g.342102  ORF Transcript_109754/g.342102 Transcript_109754/m.342102 type:complete len:256 (+) Transcript_109754:1217-1984(+)